MSRRSARSSVKTTRRMPVRSAKIDAERETRGKVGDGADGQLFSSPKGGQDTSTTPR